MQPIIKCINALNPLIFLLPPDVVWICWAARNAKKPSCGPLGNAYVRWTARPLRTTPSAAYPRLPLSGCVNLCLMNNNHPALNNPCIMVSGVEYSFWWFHFGITVHSGDLYSAQKAAWRQLRRQLHWRACFRCLVSSMRAVRHVHRSHDSGGSSWECCYTGRWHLHTLGYTSNSFSCESWWDLPYTLTHWWQVVFSGFLSANNIILYFSFHWIQPCYHCRQEKTEEESKSHNKTVSHKVHKKRWVLTTLGRPNFWSGASFTLYDRSMISYHYLPTYVHTVIEVVIVMSASKECELSCQSCLWVALEIILSSEMTICPHVAQNLILFKDPLKLLIRCKAWVMPRRLLMRRPWDLSVIILLLK